MKIVTYHQDEPGGLQLSKRGSIWAIGIDTETDGLLEITFTLPDACDIREFFSEAYCSKCSETGDHKPKDPQ